MPKRTQKKRAQRRQRAIENDINENGVDNFRSGQFRVFNRKTRKYISEPLAWDEAVKVWQEGDQCIILDSKHARKGS